MRSRLLAIFLAVIGLASIVWAQADVPVAAAAPQRELRLAVVGWDAESMRQYEYANVLRSIAAEQHVTLRVQLAVGTYGEVLHWIDRGLVDVAVLTPAAFCQTAPLVDVRGAPRCHYIASRHLEDPDAPGRWRDHYRSVCLVPAHSSIKNFDDLQRDARAGNVQFLFVDPLSTSGRIVPAIALKDLIGVEKPPQYTYGHNDSIRILADRDDEIVKQGGDAPQQTELAAFTFRGKIGVKTNADTPGEETKVRVLDVPALNRPEFSIPADVLVARPDYDFAWLKASLLHVAAKGAAATRASDPGADLSDPHAYAFYDAAQAREGEDEVATLPRLRAHFANCTAWLKEVDVHSEFDAPVGIEQIIGFMQHDQRNGKPVRLAIVLAGGGARCSYQAGAMSIIEPMLAAAQTFPSAPVRPKIELVVGTSGGAINTVPTAMGVSATPEGAEALENVWRGLGIQRIIRPKLELRILLGLCIAWVVMGAAAVSSWFWNRRVAKRIRKRGGNPGLRPIPAWVETTLFVFVPAVGILTIFYCPWIVLLDRIASSRPVLYSALAVFYGSRWAATFLLLVVAQRGLWATRNTWTPWLGVRLWTRFLRWRYDATWRVVRYTLVFLTPVALLLSTGFRSGSIIEDANMKPTIVRAYEGLVPGGVSGDGGGAARARDVAKKVIELPTRRDMAFTGSNVRILSSENIETQGHGMSRSEVGTGAIYFYAPSGESEKRGLLPRFANRGFCLMPGMPGASRHADPEKLIDFVLGSGTIYPFFSPRSVSDFPEPGETSELVDGSFAHNSPIEAAVEWGATHIIVIAVAPAAKPGPSTNAFVSNVGIALNYLYDQAQLTDAAAQEQVPVFTLRPQAIKDPRVPPGSFDAHYPSIVDFSPKFVSYAIALGEANASHACFERENGRPNFQVFEAKAGR